MSLSAPKETSWVIALVLVLLGLLASLVPIPSLAPYALWIVLAGAVLLLLATLLNDL